MSVAMEGGVERREKSEKCEVGMISMEGWRGGGRKKRNMERGEGTGLTGIKTDRTELIMRSTTDGKTGQQFKHGKMKGLRKVLTRQKMTVINQKILKKKKNINKLN